MSSARRAVIDVGTNSVKLLVADVKGRTVVPLLEKSEQTRLGEGFYETHWLQPAAITKTSGVIARYVREALAFGVVSTRVVATSAVRDAINQAELLETVERESGLRIEVISGEQEAHWAFSGVTTDPSLAEVPLLILDVGGGSTEFIVGRAEVQCFRQSFPLGTVRLLEQLKPNDPPTQRDWAVCEGWLQRFLREKVEPVLKPSLMHFPPGHVQLVGTGGTTTILARIKLQTNSFDRGNIEAVRLSREEVRSQRERLWSLPLAARREIVGLPQDRADLIPFGAAIFDVLMETFEFREVRVSTRGLRFAAVMEP